MNSGQSVRVLPVKASALEELVRVGWVLQALGALETGKGTLRLRTGGRGCDGGCDGHRFSLGSQGWRGAGWS